MQGCEGSIDIAIIYSILWYEFYHTKEEIL
jgi:hypothetical protein